MTAITTDIHTLSMIAITSTGDDLIVRTKVLGSMIIFLNLDRVTAYYLCASSGLSDTQVEALVGEVFAV